MRNFSAFIIIIIAIIYYVIVPIGALFVLIGICIAIVSMLIWFSKLIRNHVLKTKNKQLFYNKLSSLYHISLNQEGKSNLKLSSAIEQILTKYYCPSELGNEFKKLKESIRNSLDQASIWKNNKILNEYAYKGNNLSRNRLSFSEIAILGSKSNLCSDYFTVKAKGIKLHFFPYFIITEIDCGYDLIEFTDVSVIDKNTISVEESSTSSIKGANPAYYNYLHQRIDGGPDRRYKNNPSTPVYLYDIFKLYVGKEIQIISASSRSTLNIINSINRYQCELSKYQVLSTIYVKDIDISEDEYASLIKKFIVKYGKDFILSKSFVNRLKDYRVSIRHPYFIPIIEILYQSDNFKNIILDDCRYDQLDMIKNTVKESTAYSELEIATVLALLGYGLQIKA